MAPFFKLNMVRGEVHRPTIPASSRFIFVPDFYGRAGTFFPTSYAGFLLLGLSLCFCPRLEAEAKAASVLHSDFERSFSDYNPWAGIDGADLLHVIPGKQLAVDDAGTVLNTSMGPSVAVGDLNGDGLPDLVVGDANGFFWYYPNSGTATQPKFTHGEVMPVWFGNPRLPEKSVGPYDNIVPRIQLVDLSGQGKLDLVVGNYEGKLFYLHNMGTGTAPAFKMPATLDQIMVNTHTEGQLWCNYLAPFLYDWKGSGNLDLIVGDGSYAANSIFLFMNQGNRDQPRFDENHEVKIIPGMGREHLTPQVVDWNGDGKPDIITGERSGPISVFLNTSVDADHPQFDEGRHVLFGGTENLGGFSTVAVADLTGNKLPNLVISNGDDTFRYAQNNGTRGNPSFAAPVMIKGKNPYPKILRPYDWHLVSPFGVANELLVCTNAEIEPGFTPPPDYKGKSAMKFYLYPTDNPHFKDRFYPQEDTHAIQCTRTFNLKAETSYELNFWVRTDGDVRDLVCQLGGAQIVPPGPDHPRDRPGPRQIVIEKQVSTTSSWNRFSDTCRFLSLDPKKRDAIVGFRVQFQFQGQGSVYLDDVNVLPGE